MSQISPFTYVQVQAIDAQRRGAVDKTRQLQRAAVAEKDMAAHEDTLEHQVESTEEVSAVGDEAEQEKNRRKRPKPPRHGEEADDEKPHIDLTA